MLEIIHFRREGREQSETYKDLHPDVQFTALHRKKKVRDFPVPSRDVTTKLSLGGNNDVITELFLPRGSLVSDIPAGDGKLVNLFLRCMLADRSWSLLLYCVRSQTFTV
jgi:hypothetical protein